VVAHPTDNQGVQIAIAGRRRRNRAYDVRGWPEHLATRADGGAGRASHVARADAQALAVRAAQGAASPDFVERALGDAVEQVRGFAAAGGQVLFGTDVGYMTDYDPTDEYAYLAVR
jgi:hypothetical protein